MNLLPKWRMQAAKPAFTDFESVTSQEAVAKLYAAMNELIGELNKMNDHLTEFENAEKANREEFEKNITVVMREFNCSFDQKISNLESFAETLINAAIKDGRITVTEVYDPDTESLNTVVGGEV